MCTLHSAYILNDTDPLLIFGNYLFIRIALFSAVIIRTSSPPAPFHWFLAVFFCTTSQHHVHHGIVMSDIISGCTCLDCIAIEIQ